MLLPWVVLQDPGHCYQKFGSPVCFFKVLFKGNNIRCVPFFPKARLMFGSLDFLVAVPLQKQMAGALNNAFLDEIFERN